MYENYLPFARCGRAPNPLSIQADVPAEMPSLSLRPGWQWDQVCDYRAQQVAELTDSDDAAIYVFWSGGIDSTVILAALLRNWRPDQLSRVRVVMNNASYFENPWFFDHVIRPHLKYISQAPEDWTTAWLINGYPGDTIWIQADILEINRWRPGAFKKNLRTQPDDLLAWLSNKTDRSHAHWLIEMLVNNAQDAGLELEDYEDFYWWLNFNFMFAGEIYKAYHHKMNRNYDRNDLQCYYQRSVSWYASHEYQSWSIENRSNGVKYQGDTRSYKMPAKQYIYDLDHNPWYRDYKTKMASSKLPIRNKILGIWQDGTTVIDAADTFNNRLIV